MVSTIIWKSYLGVFRCLYQYLKINGLHLKRRAKELNPTLS